MRQHALPAGQPPRLLLVTGGKGGVGTTTVAVNLAVAMTLNASRVVLVDADTCRADVSTMCGLGDQSDATEIVASRRDIHEVIQPGPAGVQIVPGLWGSGQVTELTETKQRHLVKQWMSLRRHADVVVLDAGNASSRIVKMFWEVADDILLLTTPDSAAVMDAYATVKVMKQDKSAPVRLIVNQATQHEAQDVHQRIDQSCQRFLEMNVSLLGRIGRDDRFPLAASAGCPLVMQYSDGDATKQIQQIVAALGAPRTAQAESIIRAA